MSITRREFLKRSAGATTGAVLAGDGLGADGATRDVADAGWRPRQFERKPDIVVVVLDDVGFADLGCYGSEHRTPAIDAIAAGGVRFNNFHVTALCAPTRACGTCRW